MILNGKGVGSGVAVGKILIYKKSYFVPQERFIREEEVQDNLDRYFSVKKQAMDELDNLIISLNDNFKAAIFNAQKEIADDLIINEEIPSKIKNDLLSGDRAVYQVYETVINVLQKTDDPIISQRAADFDDVRTLLLRLWSGDKDAPLSTLTEPVIIACHDLSPSDTASMDRDKVIAILTETGGATSHTAIIAKSYGIPTILGISSLLQIVKHGERAAVNADDGIVILNPDENITNEYIKKSEIYIRGKLDNETFRDMEAITSCGIKIDIGLNIANSIETELKAHSYTDFTGLFRTEFLFMERDTLPSEDEQFFAYKKILETYKEKPVILRTIDIGVDKPLSNNIEGVKIPFEENPSLGNRALRFCFTYPEIFITQIRACLRASAYGNLWIMLPMVCSIDDIRKAKEIILSVKNELVLAGVPIGAFKIGIMIEIPSISLLANHVVKEVDFASIGTNDLCQYLCAADRMNSAVELYYQSYHPSLFKLIHETVKVFKTTEKPLSICGELASDTLAVPALIGLGLRKLSMGTASIAAIKKAITSLDITKAEELAMKILLLPTAQDVKDVLNSFN